MANQLSKFTPNLADMTKPLRDLLSHRNQWCWGEPQQRAFNQVKKILTKSPVLAAFDPSLETTVSADASSYGIGGVLLQKQKKGEIRPVAYISRAMTPTEQRYAQIEKEALALTWACERLQDYLVGLQFCVETDHKPLVPLFSSKILDELPLRVQRFRMRMMRFRFSIRHVPGKQLSTADALSRAPTTTPSSSDNLFQDEVEAYIQVTMQDLPATEKRLAEIQVHQEQDKTCKMVRDFCKRGWPKKAELPDSVKPFYAVSGELVPSQPVDERKSTRYSERSAAWSVETAPLQPPGHLQMQGESKAVSVVAGTVETARRNCSQVLSLHQVPSS